MKHVIWAVLLCTASSMSSAQGVSDSPQAIDGIESAWCNPKADDDCYINNVKVPVNELGKYLPQVRVSDVEEMRGNCEFHICYNWHEQPVGIPVN